MRRHAMSRLRRSTLLGLILLSVGCSAVDEDERAASQGDSDGVGDPLGPRPGVPRSPSVDAGVATRDDSEGEDEETSESSRSPDAGAPVVISPFVDARKDPFSTFAADVDTASYDYLRQGLQTSGTLPAPQYVRVEDYVNYFHYDYPTPAADAAQPFAIALAASAHPLGRPTTLLRVGIQAKKAPPQPAKDANLVFLVDTSGSMASPDKLPLVQRVIEASLDVLAPSTKLSIVSYAGDTTVRLKPTLVSSRDAIVQAVRGLSAGGGTNGASGIELAYEQAQAGLVPNGINHVILCTDGDFNLGITSNDALVKLIRTKRDSGITLTALGFGRDNLNDAMMERVSNAGNGMYSLVYSADQAVEYANERLLSTVVHVAKDMKIQVEFNPAHVLAYRLLGYEDRAVADDDFRDDAVDGGEVGAEHRVTALYELVLAGGALPEVPGAPALSAGEAGEGAPEIAAAELVAVKVRSKPVTARDSDPASETRAALTPSDVQASADQDSAWAAAVAGLAELLRQSPYVAPGELDAIRRILTAQASRDSDRAELVSLLGKPSVVQLLGTRK